jgi:hypothetical protein
VGARGDQSRDVPLHQVGEKRAEQHPQEQRAASCTVASASPGVPRRYGASVAPPLASSSTQASIAAGVSWRCTAERLGASEAVEDVVATLGPQRAAPRRGGAFLTMAAT